MITISIPVVNRRNHPKDHEPEMRKWLKDQGIVFTECYASPDHIFTQDGIYYTKWILTFQKKSDALLFKLTWGGA